MLKIENTEVKSCDNCKHSYIDDLFYEWCCRLKGCHVDLDEEGFPVENTKCKKREKDNTEK